MDDPVQLAQAAADYLLRTAKDSVARHGRFILAVSGGSTPRPLYRTLAEEPYRSHMPWGNMELFWVDERCVRPDDPASNYGTAKLDWLSRVPLIIDQIHPIPVDCSPEEGALGYEKELMRSFNLAHGEFPVFDLILLGMGKDGHTASLFPGQKALHEMKRLVLAVHGGDPKVSRITMTLPILNRSNRLIFLISGKEKADTLKTVLETNRYILPAQRIVPMNGTVTWFVTRDAAMMLSRDAIHD